MHKIKKGASMRFYNEKEQLQLETDVSGVRFGTGLLYTRDGMCFPKDKACGNSDLQSTALTSKSLTSTETHLSNIEREPLGILHGIEIFHHC